MKELVIVLVPKDASPRALEAALRRCAAAPPGGEPRAEVAPTDFERRKADESPLWTWFVPNPCPTRGDGA